MKLRIIALFFFSLSAFAAAQSLRGTVTNGTTGTPAANAEVTLISLANGMNEAAHTRTDAAGRFTLDLAGDTGMPHLVRVTHQDVNYFKMAPPGTSTADVQIYDVAKKLDGIATAVQIMRLQSDGNGLQVMELYAVRNNSSPARTLGGDRTFDIALPEGAALDTASARAPNGQPISATPVPIDGRKGQYSFGFPLRPGETQFEVAYHLPYNGQTTIKPILLHDARHFVAMLPKTMQFAPAGKIDFASMPDDTGANVQVVTNAKAGAPIAFTVSGTGMLSDDNGSAPAHQPTGGSHGRRSRRWLGKSDWLARSAVALSLAAARSTDRHPRNRRSLHHQTPPA
jgi:5-hydroxyisourate hydrolase-like protein (transthyretin family)